MLKRKQFTHSQATLEKLLEEAMVDAYGDDEQFTGVVVSLEDNLPFPFDAEVVGETVEVLGVDEGRSGLPRGIVAKVQRGGMEYYVGLSDLQMPRKIQSNQYWEMYEYWLER